VDVALAVIARAGKVLVTRRGGEDALAGLWEFPGGKIARGETPEEAAARECREEIGWEVAPGRVLAVTEHRYRNRTVRLHAVLCEPADGAAAPAGPRGRVRWVRLERLSELAMPPANGALLRAMAAGLAGGGSGGGPRRRSRQRDGRPV